MAEHSKLVKMRISNIGCIGTEGLDIELDKILTLVGVNNSGKSTVLKAYELAAGTVNFTKEDRCVRGLDKPSSVELWVHIPVNTPNIPEKWKYEENGLKLVLSKWEWDLEFKKTRKTWDPDIDDYAEDGKAAGVDNVFNSRLPKPFRIGTLEDPAKEHDKLLNLILQPISEKLKLLIEKEDSELKKTISAFINLTKLPVDEEQKTINSIAVDLNKNHNEIFPNLSILFDIGVGDLEINPAQLLAKNSRIKFKDWSDEIDWNRQGTGSQRALFWSILQVRSKLATINEMKTQHQKELIKLQKEITALEKKIPTLKKADAIQENTEKLEVLKKSIETLRETANSNLPSVEDDLSLPGYMLLIDEPEVGLHPNAIRAASKYLYSLALDPSWQVMITTHSPQFVNPLNDHTTIIRLERNNCNLSPKTYRSDQVTFSEDEKENLKMINRFDQALAEMFFGQKPIIIEGDTEYAAFEYLMNNFPEYSLSQRPVLIRARGKDTINLIIRMLQNFKVTYSVLHDSDFATKGVAWSANERIYSSVQESRKHGCKVIHRFSIPTFEFQHLPIVYDKNKKIKEHADKEKPWNFISKMKNSEVIKKTVKGVFDELFSDTAIEDQFNKDTIKSLTNEVNRWTKKYCPKDERFEVI